MLAGFLLVFFFGCVAGTLLLGISYAAPAAIFTASFADGPRRVDPIVSPGGQSAHEHCFYGVRGVTNTETSASLRAKPSTWVEQDNHSAFWIPCVYEDGRLLTPATSKHLLAYYQSVSGTERVPPENTAGVSHEMGYRCGTGGGTITNLPPASCPAGTPIVVSGFMRGARDLGLSEPFPNIRVFIRLSRGARGGALGNVTVGGPAVGVNGGAVADTIHFDYFWAWDRAAFQRFLNQCVIPGTGCGTNPDV